MDEKQQPDSQRTKSDNDAPEAQVAESLSAMPQKPPAEGDLAKTEQKLDKVEEMSGFERSTLRWTRATFGILAVTCLFIGFQWLEMNSGSKDTHELAVAAKTQVDKMKDVSDAAEKIRQAADNMVIQDKRIADNAQSSLDASNAQSKAALSATIAQSKESLQATIRNAQDEERAWITANSLKLSEEPTLNKPVTVTVGIINTGRTPALHLVNESVLSSWAGGAPRTNFPLPANPVSRGILAPGTTPLTYTTDPLTLNTDQQIAAYTSKTNNLYIESLLRYDDTFKRPHWTRICAYHTYGTPLESFVYCTMGNEIDQGGQQNPN